METIKVRIWTGEEMLGPFDLSQNPKYWASEMKDGVMLLGTGLKDKNGIEIYSGDIIKVDFARVVEFVDEYAGFSPFVNDGGCGDVECECCSDVPYYLPQECEVIGNAFENPELLQEEL